ncbi:hypothetical protein BH23ACT12_BH23ACT12_02370 [soil metagenome]
MRKRLRNSLVIGMLLMLTVMSGPVDASPLQSVTASAYGLEATGLVAIPRTPTVSTTFPPAANVTDTADLATIPADPLAFAGVASVGAQTAVDSTLTAGLPADRLTVQGGGTLPANFNARATSRIAGLSVLASAELLGIPVDVGLSAVGVGAVESEALVSCVDGNAVFVAGSRIVGPLTVLGVELEVPVDNLANQVVDVTGTLLAGILEIRRNVVTSSPNGVSVIALQVRLVDTTLVVNLAEAAVAGGVCAPLFVAAEPDILPRTGGDNVLMGFVILALGGLMFIMGRKLRNGSIQG